MHPLLTEKLAQQRLADLRREADAWRAAQTSPRRRFWSFVAGIRRARRRHAPTPGAGGVAPVAATCVRS